MPINLFNDNTGVDKYPAKAHAHRVVDKLQLSDGVIALAGTPSRTWPDSDMVMPFRQARYFFYLTGCNEADCYVTYDIRIDRLTLWLPPISQKKAVWGGQGSTIEEALEKYDVDEAKYLTLKRPRRSFISGCVLGRNTIEYGYDMKLTCAEDESRDPCQIIASGTALEAAIDACRVVKDEHEVRLIKQANLISAASHTAVLRALPNLRNEAEVEAIFVGTSIAHQAKEQAYQPIVGSGPNAATLHYATNNQNFGSRQTLLIDAGAEWNCYASDVTRTMPLNTKNPGYWMSKEAEQIYELVENIQETCIRMLKPGAVFLDVHYKAQSIALSGLLSLGILEGSYKDMLEAGTIRAFFPHGLGHHIGLECHDVSGEPRPASSTRNYAGGFLVSDKSPCTLAAPSLVPGNIVTIEPGIYFNDASLKLYLKDEKHAKFVNESVLRRYIDVGGVRIEDCILVTKDGFENLTTAPKGKAALEIIRKAAK